MAEKNGSPVRIALAEDEADLRLAMVRLLEQLGHQVVCAAANGEELLNNCFQDQVDLALVDLDMPVVDGLTAAEQLGERGIPVVLVSGHPDVEHVVIEHEPIATRILKPMTLDGLQSAIKQALSAAR